MHFRFGNRRHIPRLPPIKPKCAYCRTKLKGMHQMQGSKPICYWCKKRVTGNT